MKIDRAVGCIFIHYPKPPRAAEISSIGDQILNDPELRVLPFRVHDLRDVRPWLEAEDIRIIAANAARQRERLTEQERLDRKVAAILPHDLAFGLGRMLEVYIKDSKRETRQFRAFRTFAEAAEWMELGDDYVDPFSSAIAPSD